ncbi:hypothetical protein BYT27DRAFT_7233606 [Phlegmacium glaucopus]|nr:hypothetical protein BYT27DRAFT_7233606 [Phlegmacium glaucopus]
MSNSSQQHATRQRLSPIDTDNKAIFADNLLSDAEHEAQDSAPNEILQFHDWVVGSRETTRSLIFLMVAQAATKLNPDVYKMVTRDEVNTLLSDERIQNIIDEDIKNRQFRNIRNLAVLRRSSPLPTPSQSQLARGDGHLATMLSWDEAYIGEAHEVLYETITSQIQSEPQAYARYQAIVQSSGMGKSRMVDELSKQHLVIPINLRNEGSGFPPGDAQVLDFLKPVPFDQIESYKRSQAFLISLFKAAYEILEGIAKKIKGVSPEKRQELLSQKFREYMSAGQTFEKHGSNRVQFYNKVISQAKSLMNSDVKLSIKHRDVCVPDAECKSEAHSFGRMSQSPTQEITFTEEGMTSTQLCPVLTELLRLLHPNLPNIDGGLSAMPPIVLLAFDEAHGLCFPEAKTGQPPCATVFSEMRRAIRQMIEFPLFALFLSTTGNVHDFTPPPKDDASNRLSNQQLKLFPPFTELGFDQMLKADNLKIVENIFDIDDVSRVGFMARYGRPLFGSRYKNGLVGDQNSILRFAKEKLTGGRSNPAKFLESAGARLACLSVRLALEFNPISTEVRARELEQVEKYMRVCLVVYGNFETAMTVSPSEPILAEAARSLMKDNPTFDVPRSLLEQLEKPGLDKGDRGELVAELLLILASDAAYHKKAQLPPKPNTRSQTIGSLKIEIEPTTSRAVSLESFIKELLAKEQHDHILNVKPAKSRTPTEGQQSFGATFNESKVYFNHFIKITDPNVIKRDFLWRLIARGAAVLCANGQRGVDIVVPFMYCAGKLSRINVSAIFIQVKNDAAFTTKPNVILFDLMNPYFLRFFDMDEEEPLPVIRMVFALASRSPAIEVIPPKHERFPQTAKIQAADKSSKGSPRYTSYDIWCARACSDTFGVIKPGDDDTYANLLKVCKVFPAAYTDGIAQHVPSVESMRRKMNPGTATGADHWNEFCGGDIREKVEDTADNVDFSYEDEEE